MKKILISIKEHSGISRTKEPVHIGVPLPKSYATNVNDFKLTTDQDKSIDFQISPLVLWPDQSYKWITLDFQSLINSGEVKNYYLQIDSKKIHKTQGITIEKVIDGWKINTGKNTFIVNNNNSKPLLSNINDAVSTRILLSDSENNEYEAITDQICIETKGKIHTIIRVEGFFGVEKSFARFIARLHFFIDKSYVQIDFTIWNPKPSRHSNGLWDLGDPGSIFFNDLSICTELTNNNPSNVSWRTEPDGILNSKSLKNLTIYQDSSGGENWQSINHINCHGKLPISFKGYKVEKDKGSLVSQGLRAEPVIHVGNEKNGVSCAIKRFWQNFPNALEINNNRIFQRIFPKQFDDLYELQGGEKKTHTVFIDYNGSPESISWVHDPLIPIIDPAWSLETKVIPYFSFDSSLEDDFYKIMVKKITKGDNTFFHKREAIDEYGWRNFGDVYADHEAVRHTKTTPFISHYNNQYDLLYSCILQYIKKSDLSFLELANDQAHHIRDIDIYWTNLDRKEYNGGMHWHTNHHLDAETCTHRSFSEKHIAALNIDPKYYGGGPSPEHNYTTGLLFHYYISGDVFSKECVLQLADWVVNMISGSDTVLATLYNLKKRYSSKFIKILKGDRINFHKYALTRASGNSINTLLDAYELSQDKNYLHTAELIIKGCIHPLDDINSREIFSYPEELWSYTIVLQSIGKYLFVKEEIEELDAMYCYAKESFLHYAEWINKNEYPYLDKPEMLQIPNETWSGQDLRKSSILYIAARYCKSIRRNSYIKKAKMFYDRSIQDLFNTESSIFVRPTALMLQNSSLHFYFQENPDEAFGNESSNCTYDRDNNLLTPGVIVSEFIKQLTRAIINFSFKDEVRWLKCRLNKHI